MIKNKDILILFFLLILFFGWFSPPLLTVSSSDIRILEAYHVDEAGHVFRLRQNLDQNTFYLMFNNYGHLCFNLALLILLPLNQIIQVTDQHIIFVLRLISLIFAAGTVVLVFELANRLWGRLSAWIAATGLMLIPAIFHEYAVISHPDVPQIFFLVLGIYFCIRYLREIRRLWFFLASVTAGLAFATKYSGLFTLAVLWIVFVYTSFSGQNKAMISGSRIVVKGMFGIGGICLILAVLLSPDVMVRLMTADGELTDPHKRAFLSLIRLALAAAGAGLLFMNSLALLKPGAVRLTTGIQKADAVFLHLAGSAACFVGTFFLASPYSWVGLNFLSGILFESRHTTAGHLFFENRSPWLWIQHLTSSLFLGKVIFALVLLRLGYVICHLTGKKRRQNDGGEMVIWTAMILYLLYLIFRVNMIRSRYLMPLLPFLFCVAGAAGAHLMQSAGRIRKHGIRTMARTILVLTALVLVFQALLRAGRYRHEIRSWEQTSPTVTAGRWMAETYPDSTVILFDHFVYVPVDFRNSVGSWDATTVTLDTVDPDVVVTHQYVSENFSDSSRADAFVSGNDRFMDRYHYYRGLADGSLGYTHVKSMDKVRIYEKNDMRRKETGSISTRTGSKPLTGPP